MATDCQEAMDCPLQREILVFLSILFVDSHTSKGSLAANLAKCPSVDDDRAKNSKMPVFNFNHIVLTRLVKKSPEGESIDLLKYIQVLT